MRPEFCYAETAFRDHFWRRQYRPDAVPPLDRISCNVDYRCDEARFDAKLADRSRLGWIVRFDERRFEFRPIDYRRLYEAVRDQYRRDSYLDHVTLRAQVFP